MPNSWAIPVDSTASRPMAMTTSMSEKPRSSLFDLNASEAIDLHRLRRRAARQDHLHGVDDLNDAADDRAGLSVRHELEHEVRIPGREYDERIEIPYGPVVTGLGRHLVCGVSRPREGIGG